MLETFDCPSCGKLISAEVEPATPVACPYCQRIVTVPRRESPPPAQPVGGAPLNQTAAVAALVCGLVNLTTCLPAGAAGLPLGWRAMRNIRREPGRYGGRGLAVAGLWTSGIGLVLTLFGAVAIYPAVRIAFREFHDLENRNACKQNLVAVADALFEYAQDDGRFPDSLDRLVKQRLLPAEALHCPSDAPGAESYVYLTGFGLDTDGEQVVVYENPLIHGGTGGHLLTADGRVRFIAALEFEDLIEDAAREAETSALPPGD